MIKKLSKITSIALGLFILSAVVAQAQERLVVFDFSVNSGISGENAVTLTNKFRSEITKAPQFVLVERAAMEQVISEQRFSVSDLADQEKAVELGKLLSASKVIVGDIGRINQTYSITIRLIDVQTGSVDNSENLQYRGALDGLLVELEVMAQKLTGTYKEKKKRGWLYITGVAVIGAVTTALLLQDDGGAAGLPLPPGPPDN